MHPTFEKDMANIRFWKNMRYVLWGAGALFALTVYNPNFVARRSWYMRKFSVVVFGGVGYAFGNKFYADATTTCWLRMHDYFPMEIKRGLRDKDFRHVALFDLEEALKTRECFDKETGKSLS